MKKSRTDDVEVNVEELEYVKVGKIRELFIYPVKSMKGISVSYIECSKTGGNYNYIRDRSFMVINRKTLLHVGATKEKKLILIEPSINYDNLTSSYILKLTYDKNSTFVNVNLNDIVKKGYILTVKVKDGGLGDGLCDGYDCGDEIVTQQSLNDLNKRYNGSNQIVVERFRPIIVVNNTKVYDDDYWRYIKIGTCLLGLVRPCTRCTQITIDPETAEKHLNMEPLTELRKYRLTKDRIEKEYRKNPVFGIQLGIKNGGVLKVGGDVFVNYKKIQF